MKKTTVVSGKIGGFVHTDTDVAITMCERAYKDPVIVAYSQMTNTVFKQDTITATLRAQNHICGCGGSEALIVTVCSNDG